MSIINVRQTNEAGFRDDTALCESKGCEYFIYPISPPEWSKERVDGILSIVDEAPKPVLVHCGGNVRAAAIALLHEMRQGRLDKAQAISQAEAIHPIAAKLVVKYLEAWSPRR